MKIPAPLGQLTGVHRTFPARCWGGDELYLLDDRSFFHCYRAIDRKQHFKGRLPGLANFSASPAIVIEAIYVRGERDFYGFQQTHNKEALALVFKFSAWLWTNSRDPGIMRGHSGRVPTGISGFFVQRSAKFLAAPQ